MKCLECLDDFSTERGLHLHVSKKHKISIQDYYHKFFPRFDLFSNEKIEFAANDALTAYEADVAFKAYEADVAFNA